MIKKEIISSSHYNSGFIQEIKQLLDKRVYPKYANDKENIDSVWELCEELTMKSYDF